MNNKDVKGIAVISIADGTKLGAVERAYLDPEAKRLVGFAFGAGGGLLAGETEATSLVDVDKIHSLGPDALTLDRPDAAQGQETGAAGGSLIDLDELTKRKVVTDGGTFVGQVASVEFDERSFRLTQIEASPGFFKSNRTIPIDQVISLGSDVVVVSDAVCASEAATAGATSGAEGRFVVGDVTAQP